MPISPIPTRSYSNDRFFGQAASDSEDSFGFVPTSWPDPQRSCVYRDGSFYDRALHRRTAHAHIDNQGPNLQAAAEHVNCGAAFQKVAHHLARDN